MVEVTQLTQGFAESAARSGQVTAFIMIILLFLFLIFGIIAFFIYKAKFNIDVIYMPMNDEPMMTGLKARDYFTGKGKDYRFKIWGAKKLKLKYNEEAIEPQHISIHKTTKGKIRRLLWMTSDTSGMLIPSKVVPDLVTQVVRRINEEGKEVEEKIVSRVLRAKYTDIDVSWLQMEKDKWINIFRPKDKQMMWMFIVIAVLMTLCLGGFLWGVNKNANVSETNLAIATQQSNSNALLAETLCVVTQKCLNNTVGGVQQPFNSIITT
jgi:hypothetical protein